MKRTVNRILTAGMVLLMGASLVLAVAISDSTTWTGQGSDSVCPGDTTLHWVLTTDGQANTISNAVLTLGGSGSGSFPMTQIDSSASWQVTTPFFDLNTLTAVASYNLLTGSNANFNLVISNGCSTPPVPELNPMILTTTGLLGLVGLVMVTRRKKT